MADIRSRIESRVVELGLLLILLFSFADYVLQKVSPIISGWLVGWSGN